MNTGKFFNCCCCCYSRIPRGTQLYALLKDTHDFGSRFKRVVATRTGLDNYGGMSSTSAEGTTHTVRQEEQVAFSNWINRFD